MKKLVYILSLLLLCASYSCNKHNNYSCDRNRDSSCVEQDTIVQKDTIVSSCDYQALWADSFIVNYRKAINGYAVKAVVKTNFSAEFPVLAADMYFTKGGRTFMLHSSCFADTSFCKGRIDMEEYNVSTFKKLHGRTVQGDYTAKNDGEETMLRDVPFFFKDLDFDNVPELVIVHKSMAVRFHDGYDVYRIVEGVPVLIDVPPYNQDRKDWGFGMTDYPAFDFDAKTIVCPYPEGELHYEGYITYGISKREKELVIVNGHRHYFNKIVQM